MITIHCNEPSHPKSIGEIEIATFTSTITYGTADSVEAWDAAGPHLTVTQTTPPELTQHRPGVVQVAAGIAGRYRFRCPACGLDVVAGDRFGGRNTQIGFAAFFETSREDDLLPVEEIKRRVAIGFATRDRLTQLADSGVSRLSLSALGNMLQK